MNLRRTQTFSPYHHLSIHFSHTTTSMYMKVKVLVTQLCPTLCDPMDCSPPCSSVHGILQARMLEWVAIRFSRGSSQPRDGTWVSWIMRFFTIWATREANLLPYALNRGGKKKSTLDDSVIKNLPANTGDVGSIPGPGRHPGEGNGNLLQYSCLENPMDRGAWWATVHGVAKESDTTEQPNNNQLPCDSPMIFLQINIPLKPGKGVQYSGSLLWGGKDSERRLY